MSKVILITGASSGFGKLAAKTLLQRGHVVYGAARRVDEMEDLLALGGRSMSMDVTQKAQIKRGVKQIVSDQGHLDVLINNAGLGACDFVETADLKPMRAMFEVNFWGLVLASQAALPVMREQRSGRIINVSSLAGKMSTASLGFYAASKHAVEAISDAMRQEVLDFGIKVSIIEPGVFKTGFDDAMSSQFDAVRTVADYQPQLNQLKKLIDKSFARAPKPDPVIKAMIHAVERKNPKTRYLVGFDAMGAVAAGKVVSDAMIDRIVRMQMKWI